MGPKAQSAAAATACSCDSNSPHSWETWSSTHMLEPIDQVAGSESDREECNESRQYAVYSVIAQESEKTNQRRIRHDQVTIRYSVCPYAKHSRGCTPRLEGTRCSNKQHAHGSIQAAADVMTFFIGFFAYSPFARYRKGLEGDTIAHACRRCDCSLSLTPHVILPGDIWCWGRARTRRHLSALKLDTSRVCSRLITVSKPLPRSWSTLPP